MNEPELIEAARQGSEEAYAVLYRKHLPHVKAVGRSMLRTNDLDDLCQETFLLAFTRLHSFQGKANFRTWITRIAMNQCLMILRRNRQLSNGASQLVTLDTGAAGEDLIEQKYFAVEDKQLRSTAARCDLTMYLSRLTPEQRSILTMAYLDELSDQEIAATLGTTVATVKSRLHNAKKKLRNAGARR